MKLRPGLLGAAVALAAAAACSSSSTPPAETNADSGADASIPGDSGTVQEPNDGAVAVAPPIMCGSMTCSAPAGAMFPLSPCCLPDNGCGATFGSAALSMFDAGAIDAGAICLDTSPGTPDTTCPSQSAMGFTLTGCCARSGVCGVDLSLAGLGCDSLSALAGLAPAGTGDAGVIGAPQACGGAAEGGTSDAGPDGSEPRDGGAD